MLRHALLICLLLAVPAQAKELKGVTMPDTLEMEGKRVRLNGMGLRTAKRFLMTFEVYVAGLYLEETSSDPAVILSRDTIRRVDMHMLRGLKRGEISEAITAGFKKNSADKMADLEERLERFLAVIPDLKASQVLSLTYVPGKGTTVKGATGPEFTARGKDFADALFSVWLWQYPVDDDLKRGMLGK